MAPKWQYKGVWPLSKAQQITAANFEDLRKIMWALEFLTRDPEAEDAGDVVYDEFGDLAVDLWDSNESYGFGSGSHPPYATVAYWNEHYQTHLMYSNIRAITPGQEPPPKNSNWKLRARRNIYCDYARNAGTYIFVYCGHSPGMGVYYYEAWLGSPPQFNKYTQQTVIIPDARWALNTVYNAGNIIKTTPAITAARSWALVRHKSVATYSGSPWTLASGFDANTGCIFNGIYYISTRPILINTLNPEHNDLWIRQGMLTDPAIWQSIGTLADGTRLVAEDIYGLAQEKPVQFSITDRTGRSTLAQPYAQMTGPIGTQYGRTDPELTPRTYYYYKNGGPFESDDDDFNANHYDFKKQAYQSFVESRAEQLDSYDINPIYNRHGSGDELEPYIDNNHHLWNCNFSRYEKLLKDIDSYDWYFDITFAPTAEGKAWAPLGCWRRMWKSSFSWPSSSTPYPSSSPYAGQPLIWPQELGDPPFHNWQTGEIDGSTVSSPVGPTPETSDFPWMWWHYWANVERAYYTAVAQLHAMSAELREALWYRHAPHQDYYVRNKNLERYPAGIERILQYTLKYTMVQDMYNLLLAIKYAELTAPELKSTTHGGRKLKSYTGGGALWLRGDYPAVAGIVADSSAGPPERIEDDGPIEAKPTPDMMDDSDWGTISTFENWPYVGESGLLIHYAAPTYTYAEFTDSASDIDDDCYGIYGSGWNGYYRLGWTWSGLTDAMKMLLMTEYFTNVWLTTYVRVFEGSIDVYEGSDSGKCTKHKNYSISTGAASVIAPGNNLSPAAPQETPAIWEAANPPYEWNEYQRLTKWAVVDRGLQYTNPPYGWPDPPEPIQYLIMLKATAARGSTDYRTGTIPSNSLYMLGIYRMRVDLKGTLEGILFDLDPREIALGCTPIETDWNN